MRVFGLKPCKIYGDKHLVDWLPLKNAHKIISYYSQHCLLLYGLGSEHDAGMNISIL